MKVLWLTASYNLQRKNGTSDPYHGGGWVSSLQRVIMGCQDIELAVAYITTTGVIKEIIDGTVYYPIKAQRLSSLQKFWKYYGGYKHIDDNIYVNEMLAVIEEFKPDVIHLFGIENSMCTILDKTSVPVIVHLQGLLGPCNNSFFPVGFNKSTFLYPITKREWLIRNGNIFSKNDMEVRAKREEELFRRVKFCMGRTEWDKQVSRLLSPHSYYFHVDEVLRDSFYNYAGNWKPHDHSEIVIISTLSETMYKGLDVVLKTAALIIRTTNIKFTWNIVGIDGKSDFVRFFERQLGLASQEVHIHYLGVMDEKQICTQMLQSDVYVHPSYIDNSPNSVCEAQMIGLPVITTEVGGVSSLVENGKTGILIPANAPYKLAYILSDYKNSLTTYENMSQAGFGIALARHDKERILGDLKKAYLSVL